MDMVSPILDVANRLWNCISRHASYIVKLDDTTTSLEAKMRHLKAIRDDVKQKVEVEEKQDRVRSNIVENWLKGIEETETKVDEICETREEISSHGSTCVRVYHCRSSYKLGKRATKALREVEHLISRGALSEVTIPQPHPTSIRETEGLCEIPMPNPPVGIESNLKRVLNGLKNEDVGIIGLYGMGGVGKTTLLKKVNNELPKSGDDAFDLAIWVVASKNATIETIQQSITKRLGITLSDKSVDEIRNEIYKALKKTRYILMLDDVWKKLDLFEKVGIPKPDNLNRSKIILTTRSKGVCSKMGADRIIRIECLSWEEAWSLFLKKVGKATLSAQIESVAMKIAKECKGLPLALCTIGSAMSDKEDPYEWSHALDQLQNCPTEFPDVEEEVFHVLQLSYDYLADITKQCFLYCSLFPEDYDIEWDKLIHLWMGEGYLNKNHDDIKKARDYGYSIIADLKRACLLENGRYFETVKMHDMIRDMALRIADKKFLVLEGDKFMKAKNEEVEKMSLWGITRREEKEGNSSQRDEEDLTPGNSSQEDEEDLTPGNSSPEDEEDLTPGNSSHEDEEDLTPGNSSPEDEEDLTPGNSSPEDEEDLTPGNSSPEDEEDLTPGNSSQGDEEYLTLTHKYSKLSTLHCHEYSKQQYENFFVPMLLRKKNGGSTSKSLSGLCSFIPNVRVLDLSNISNLSHLPKEISMLRNLEYLDISDTNISRLPKEMRSLGELRYLLMDFMLYLNEFPSEIIGGLSNLLMLSMYYPRNLLMKHDRWPPISKERLRVLEELQNIQEISICLDSDETIDYFLKSKKLQLLTRRITLKQSSYEVVEWNPNNMRNLEYLGINSSKLIGLKCSVAFNCLRFVSVVWCDNLVELDFIAYAPSLTQLIVQHCRSIERIVRVEEAEGLFLSLREITLFELQSLEYICNKSLSFPALEVIEIYKCPKLEQNPLNDMKPTDSKLRMIMGQRRWWDSLKWSDDSLKHHFSPFFQEGKFLKWSGNKDDEGIFDKTQECF